MKFLLITLLSTFASVTGQLMKMKDVSFSPGPMPAPEMVVYYVNEQAANTVCTEQELMYIDSKMLPDIDMTLMSNNFITPDWQVTTDATRRRTQNATCNWCRTVFPRKLCSDMYNCNRRRQLRKNDDAKGRELINSYSTLSSQLLGDCQDNIAYLSSSTVLSLSCRTALQASTCHVEIL